jgi:ABC-type transport system substrate-binding protein
MKQYLNKDVTLEPLESKTWNARRFALDLQWLLYRWYQDYPDPHNEYYQVWALHNQGQARQSWKDDQFDQLCNQAAAESDRQKRLDLYYQAETRIQTQWAYQPIHWRTDNYAIKPWIQNVPKNKQGYTVMNTNIYGRLWDVAYASDDSPHDPGK